MILFYSPKHTYGARGLNRRGTVEAALVLHDVDTSGSWRVKTRGAIRRRPLRLSTRAFAPAARLRAFAPGAFARAPHAAMASDDAKEKMRLQLSLREIYAKSTLYYYGTNHSPATPQQQRPTPTTPSTAPAAAPTRRWELAELEPASPPPAKRARPEPAPAPAPAADEPELLFSPPFKFATTAGSYEMLARYPVSGCHRTGSHGHGLASSRERIRLTTANHPSRRRGRRAGRHGVLRGPRDRGRCLLLQLRAVPREPARRGA